ncbi:MAG: LamG-like jellyroll fold domain-containing protein [Flavobacteriales bacterium]
MLRKALIVFLGITVSLTTAVYPQFTLLDSLKLYYPFNGNANDASGNGNNGTVIGGATYGTDRFGNSNSAASFDGVNDYINTGTYFDYNFRTVSLWALLNTTTIQEQAIIEQQSAILTYGGLTATIFSYTDLRALAGGTGAVTMNSSMSANTWYHIVLVRDGSSVYYYLDGHLVASAASNSSSSTAIQNNMVIGVVRNLNNRFLNGKVDELRVYNRVLSECEVRQLYCSAAPCIAQADTVIAQGSTITFNNIGGLNDSVAWSIDGTLLSSNDTLVHQFNQAGLFEVVVYASDSDCGLYDTVQVLVEQVCISNYSLDDGLQLYYPFSGNANDASGNNINGIVNGGASLSTDRYGNANSAYSFDGVNDWIDTDHKFDYQNRTVSIWYSETAGSGTRVMMTQDANTLSYGAFFGVHNTNGIQGRAGGDLVQTMDPNPQTNVWHHLVLQRSATTTNYFLDGVLKHTSTAGTIGSATDTNSHLVIGVARNETSSHWKGSLDELRVYNRVLDECEIRQLYCAAAPCIQEDDTVILQGAILTFNNVGGCNDSVAWSINGNLLSQSDTLIHQFDEPGFYYVVVFASDSNCALTDTIEILVKSSWCSPYSTLNDSLKLFYPFSSNSLDGSGYSNHGVEYGGVSLTADRYGNPNAAYEFDGINDRISTEYTYDFQNRTVSFWFTADQISSTAKVGMAQDANGFMNFGAITLRAVNGIIYCGNGAGGMIAANPYTINQWYNLTTTRNSTTSKAYLNGTLVATTSVSNSASTSFTSHFLEIGCSRSLSQFWSGKIDDLRVYNRVLTDDEIKAIYCPVVADIVENDTIVSLGANLTMNSGCNLFDHTWYLNGNSIDTASSISLVFTEVGHYQVILESSDGFCNSRDTVEVIVLPNPNCLQVDSTTKISSTQGNFSTDLDNSDMFGGFIESIGDWNNDGVPDIAVSAAFDDDGTSNTGAIYMIMLNADGTVQSHVKISSDSGGFGSGLDNGDAFGRSISVISDLNGDGVNELAVGALYDDDGGTNRGAVWILFMDSAGAVDSKQKISDTQGSFGGTLVNNDNFGVGVLGIPDINGDNIPDLIVGSSYTDDGGTDAGSFWILYMNANGTVSNEVEVSNTSGNLDVTIGANWRFGSGFGYLGDLNNDGFMEIAVGAPGSAIATGNEDGSVFIVSIDSNGVTGSTKRITEQQGGFNATLQNGNRFGLDISNAHDIDGDGYSEILVCNWFHSESATEDGAAWLISLDSSGYVFDYKKITTGTNGFNIVLGAQDHFGFGVDILGDINSDGIGDLAIGARSDDDGGTDRGAVYILGLRDTCCLAHADISINDTVLQTSSSLTFTNNGTYGDSIAWLVNGTLISNSTSFTHSFSSYGHYKILLYTSSNCISRDSIEVILLPEPNCLKVDSVFEISDTSGNFYAVLDNNDRFGMAIEALGDINGDGVPDMAVSAIEDDDGGSGSNKGAIYIMKMADESGVLMYNKISSDSGGFGSGIANDDFFGRCIADIGDINGDGVNDLAVGAGWSNDGGTDRGSLWILFLDSTGNVSAKQKISSSSGSFNGSLSNGDLFGTSVIGVPDLNNDGVRDIVVGAPSSDNAGTDDGSIWILFLNSNGTVSDHLEISAISGNLDITLSASDRFGIDLALFEAHDYSATILVGSHGYKTPINNNTVGSFYLITIDSTGVIGTSKRISQGENGFSATLPNNGQFGSALSDAHDIDGDGYKEVLVGNWLYTENNNQDGVAWLLSLDSSGYVFQQGKISSNLPQLSSYIGNGDRFGYDVEIIDDLNGDGLYDLVIGAREDDAGGPNRGAVYVLTLRDTCCPLIADFNSSSNSICSGENITFTNGSSNLFSPTYQWYIDDSLMATSANFSYTFSTVGTHLVKLVVVDSCMRSHQELITVHPNPIADAGSSTFACPGDTVQLSAAGGVLYQWNNSATLTNDTIANPLAFPSVTTIYSVTVIDSNGCSDDDNVAVILYTAPTVTVSGDSLICSGDSTLLSASGAVSYAWSPNQNISATTGTSVYVFPTYTTTYSVTGTDANGCVDSASTLIQINNTLQADININDTSVLLGTSLAFSNAGTFGDSIAWFVDGVLVSNDSSFNYSFSSFGQHEVVLKLFEPCYDADTTHVTVFFGSSCLGADLLQVISDTQGGFTGSLDSYSSNYNDFGRSVAELGDFNDDGVPDIAVGVPYGYSQYDTGAIYILFLNASGQVSSHQKISSDSGNFGAGLQTGDQFGTSICSMGDLNGDGVTDLAVGAPHHLASSYPFGAVWILFLDSSGNVSSKQLITQGQGSFTGTLTNNGHFGHSVANIGDLNGDGVNDLLVGEPVSVLTSSAWLGTAWVLFLDTAGHVTSHKKITNGQAGFASNQDEDFFGADCNLLGDINSDGNPEVLILADRNSYECLNGGSSGLIHLLSLDTGGNVISHKRLTLGESGVEHRIGELNGDDLVIPNWNAGIVSVSNGFDINGDGTTEFLIGITDEIAYSSFEVLNPFIHTFQLISLDASGNVEEQRIFELNSFYTLNESTLGRFGSSAAIVGDIDGDNISDFAFGSYMIDTLGNDKVSGLIHIFNSSINCCNDLAAISIGDTAIPIGTTLNLTNNSATSGSQYWYVNDQLIASGSNLNFTFNDAVQYRVRLKTVLDSSCTDQDSIIVSILTESGCYSIDPSNSSDYLEQSWELELNSATPSIASLGDFDGNCVGDVIQGFADVYDNINNQVIEEGMVRLVLIENDQGQVKKVSIITESVGGFGTGLSSGDKFGFKTCSMGDLNGDGITDIAVGAPGTDDGGTDYGAVWILFLDSNAEVASRQKISATSGSMNSSVKGGFGHSLTCVGDINGDGVNDLLVGAPYDSIGKAWLILLAANGTVLNSYPITGGDGSLGFGFAAAHLGDLNNDGNQEVAIGAGTTFCQGGWFYVYSITSIGSYSLMSVIYESILMDEYVYNLSPFGVINLGDGRDVDHDGHVDMLVSNGFNLFNLSLDSLGQVFKFSTLDSNFIDYNAESDQTSSLATFMGDVNGDGIDDIAMVSNSSSYTVGFLVKFGQELCNPLMPNFTESDTNICLNETVTFTNTTTGASGSESIEWYLNDTLVGTGQTLTYQFDVPGTFCLRMYVIDSTTRHHAKTIEVFDPVQFDTNASPYICFGDTVQLIYHPGGIAYQWDNSSSLSNDTIEQPQAFPTATTLYTVTITDSNHCFDTTQITVQVTPPIVASIDSIRHMTGCSWNDAKIYGSGSGGLPYSNGPPYEFLWSNGDTNDFTGFLSGTYTVSIFDSLGCSDTASGIILEPDTFVYTTSFTKPSCPGVADGTATIIPTGGWPPYTYNWNTGDTASTITSQPAGTYLVTVADSFECEVQVSISIPDPDSVVSAVDSVTIPLCNLANGFGSNTGKIYTSTSGGTSNYTYLWSNGSTSANPGGLSAGIYSLTVSDDNGCQDSLQVTVTQPDTLKVDINVTNVTCFGFNDGVGIAAASGGTGPYQYIWWVDGSGSAPCSGGFPCTHEIDSVATNLKPFPNRYYYVVAQDTHGCYVQSPNIYITQPTPLSLDDSILSVPQCFGDTTGSISISPSGATPAYSYLWSDGSTDSTLMNLGSGTYSVTVTDFNGCSDSLDVTITEPTLLVASVSLDSNVSCFTGNDGSATANATGGTTAYSYTWSSGSTAAVAPSLSATTYTVTVTDAHSCTDTASIIITEPTLLTVATTLDSNVSCFGGNDASAEAAASGGSPGYEYLWSSGSDSTSAPLLSVGFYYVTATDTKGCSAVDTIEITEPLKLTISASVLNNVYCNGDTTGTGYAAAAGGTSPYYFDWSDGTINDTAMLAAGSWTAYVTDSLGCKDSAQIIVSEPTPVLAVLDSTKDVLCNGFYDGLAFTSATGGTGSHYFNWNTGDTIDDIDSLTSGTYILSVTDDNNCLDTAVISIIELNPVIPNVTHVNVTCFSYSNGSAASASTGGGSTHTYLWNTGATSTGLITLVADTYVLTVTDEYNCYGIDTALVTQPDSIQFAFAVIDPTCDGFSNGSIQASVSGGTGTMGFSWSSGGNDSIETGVDSGLYQVTVTDANSCTNSDTVGVHDPEPLVVSTLLIDSVSCKDLADGFGLATGTGGVGTYSYLWNNADTTDTLDNVQAGTYMVTITDTNSCTNTASVDILEPDSLLAFTDSIFYALCYRDSNGYLSISTTGGNGGLTYHWSTGDSVNYIDSLASATYTITVTDYKGCFIVHSDSIEQPDTLIAVVDYLQELVCKYDSNAELGANVVGGSTPYNYAWNTGGSSTTIANLDSGFYALTITDDHGCLDTASFTLNSTSHLAAQVDSIRNLICYQDSIGYISVLADSGILPYSYSWSNSGSALSIDSLLGGIYYYTVTDSVGCIDSGSATVFEPTQLVITIDSVFEVLCYSEDDGRIYASSTGGSGVHSYLWSNSATTDSIINLDSGMYVLTVTDTNGCAAIDSALIQEPADSVHITLTVIDANCLGGANGSISSSAVGGTAPYAYLWSTGDTASAIDTLVSGTYTLTITDGHGCHYVSSDSVAQPTTPDTALLITTDITCFGANDGIIMANFVNGIPPITYQWSNNETTQQIDQLVSAAYSVTLTDSIGCIQFASDSIEEPTLLMADIQIADIIKCAGDSNGSLLAVGNGGRTPYQYQWNNLVTDSLNSTLDSGQYAVIITDSSGCIAYDSFYFDQPIALQIDSFTSLKPSCYGFNDGFIQVNHSGGTAPISYNWNIGATSPSITQLISGTYGLTLTDVNGCSIDSSFALNQPPLLTVEARRI